MATDREAVDLMAALQASLAEAKKVMEVDRDREALAEALFSTYGQESRVRSLAIADAIIASDWLAQHDAEVREATKAGIAEAELREVVTCLRRMGPTGVQEIADLIQLRADRLGARECTPGEPTP